VLLANVFLNIVLILSATRDLALLVHTLLATRCANFGITTYACVGGTAIQDDKISLSDGPHIVSGTPGRVCDMIRRRALRTDGIRLLVLNKEEMLLNRSMWPQLAAVYGLLDVETRVVRASVRVREGTV
jgi:superfamily II DNA/RNA helicase